MVETENLTGEELAALIERVFRPRTGDHAIAILIDLPDSAAADSPEWRTRREMAAEWLRRLVPEAGRMNLEAHLYGYRNARANNADLPAKAWRLEADRPLPLSADDLDPDAATDFDSVFESHGILMALTQFSATAPLKMAARRFGFRAATMPGFSPVMIPALRLDYEEINRRVGALKLLLDSAERAELVFRVDGKEDHTLDLDLRHRMGHASGGILTEPGTAGNLPSGEAFIVPYEGEIPGEESRSHGSLPVQFGDEIVVYQIRNNHAVGVSGPGKAGRREAELLVREPAYGNIAELGIGVLADFGVQPCGALLLDEKLGLHIAFGRSDHFGGQVGPDRFSRPEEVVHIDRVYVPAVQPRIEVRRFALHVPGGEIVHLTSTAPGKE